MRPNSENSKEIKLNINEVNTFQSMLDNFKTKLNTIQNNYIALSNSKLFYYIIILIIYSSI